jgi:hypothetical protein
MPVGGPPSAASSEAASASWKTRWFEDGKFLDVRDAARFQGTMQGRFTEVIERSTSREVVAFMSASHQRPDLQMEVFVLDGDPDVERPVGPTT